MKKIFSLLLVAIMLLSLTACGEKNTNTPKNETKGTEGLEYYPLPDDTYAVSAGKTKFLETIEIPSKYNGKEVTKIADEGFADCSVKEIIIPETITQIGKSAFYNCEQLSSVVLPEKIAQIEKTTFAKCTNLKTITLPQGISIIGESAFFDCHSLQSITLPNLITSISDYTFTNCKGLNSISIPSGITKIGMSAFAGCENLNGVYIDNLSNWCSIEFIDDMANPLTFAGNLYVQGQAITSMSIPENITSLKDFAFNGFTGLTELKIHSNLISIGNGTFANCTSLKSVNIPWNLTEIGVEAFKGCSNLTSAYFERTDGWMGYDSPTDKSGGILQIEYSDYAWNAKKLTHWNWDLYWRCN